MAPNLQLDILQNLISSAFSRLPAMIKQMKIASDYVVCTIYFRTEKVKLFFAAYM